MDKNTFWIIGGFCVLVVFIFIAISFFNQIPSQEYRCNQTCILECEKFNFSYYNADGCNGFKIDNCWCLDAGKPFNVGWMEVRK